MTVGQPDILVVTRDLALAHATTLAAPGEWTQTAETLGAALAAIAPTTRLLIVDTSLDAPLARLLATLFVDRQPGRRAVLVQRSPEPAWRNSDERVTVLRWPISPSALIDAVGSEQLDAWMEELEVTIAAEHHAADLAAA